MQAKLGAGFLSVALLYLLVGLGVPRLEFSPFFSVTLTASLYLVIGLGAAWLMSHLMTRRMRTLARAAARIREGDLTQPVSIPGRDEIAELGQAFGVMTESLAQIVAEVRETAEKINASATTLSATSDGLNSSTQEIAGAAQVIARGAEDQATQAKRTSATTRELTRIGHTVASRAREVHESASEGTVRATAGADDARRAAEGIESLAERNASTTEAIEGFRHRAGEIGSLIHSISSISHQTHLLAINAAIEAARAGEEGRGFAVVAEEVSRLADNVRGFAQQIDRASNEIMRGAGEVADEIRQGVRVSDEVTETVRRTLQSFEGILTAIRGTADQAHDIYQLSEKQGNAADQVRASLEEISLIAERNAEGTEEASAATRDQTLTMHDMAHSAQALARTSDRLNELVSVFKLR